ncbi:MAG: HEAT repeat domain-containing protein [Rhodothermales bacterium]|nr:HEAT repeat domain-containing protein [Rhodothermales bacterium]
MKTTRNPFTTSNYSIIRLALAAVMIMTPLAAAHAQRSAPTVITTLDPATIREAAPAHQDLITLSIQDWRAYGERLAAALTSSTEGMTQSALQRLIQYGDFMPATRQTVMEVVTIYRNNEDDRVRRMAVVALGKLGDDWSMAYLKRAVHFEKNPEVRHTITYVLKDHDGSFQ